MGGGGGGGGGGREGGGGGGGGMESGNGEREGRDLRVKCVGLLTQDGRAITPVPAGETIGSGYDAVQRESLVQTWGEFLPALFRSQFVFDSCREREEEEGTPKC